MAAFHIHLVNRDFHSSNSVELPTIEAARAEALKAGLQIGSDEICAGSTFFGAEIRIENEDGTIERMMVAIGASPLR